MVLASPARTDEARPFSVAVRAILRPVMLCLALTLLLVVVRAGATSVLEDRVERYRAVDAVLQRSHDAMLDQETGIRGWLLTGDAQFLEPFEGGQVALERHNARLAGLLAGIDDPALLGEARRVWLAQSRWAAEWAEPHLAERGSDTADLLDGKRLFDGYRAHMEAAQAVTAVRIDAVQGWMHALFVVGLSLQGALLLLASGLAVRQVRRLQLAVVAPVEGLLAAVRRIEEGQYTTALPVAGPREVRALTEGVAQMAVTLRRGDEERARREEQLARESALNAKVVDLAHEFTARLDVTHVLDAIVAGFGELAGAPAVRVWLPADDRLVLARFAGPEPDELTSALGEGLAGRAAIHGDAFSEHADGVRRLDPAQLTVCAIALPMVGGGRSQAIIELRGCAAHPLALEGKLAALKTLAAQGGVALAAAQLHQTTVELGRIDPLTGAANRRTFDDDLATEVALARRAHRDLGLVVVDVDHFKQVNDIHGHLVGDDTLREVARLLLGALRESDSLYRYGGEEFVLLLRDTDAAGALDAAGRLCQHVERGMAHRTPSATVSCGVAALSQGITDGPALVERADTALYRAKDAGRNRAVLAEADEQPLGPRVALD